MSFTIQTLVDRARVPLNDADKDRYTDNTLLSYAQDAYLMLVRYRPDIFITGFASLPDFSDLDLDSNFPSVQDMYLPFIADYVTARAEFVDDEAVVAERAQAFYSLFRSGISGA